MTSQKAEREKWDRRRSNKNSPKKKEKNVYRIKGIILPLCRLINETCESLSRYIRERMQREIDRDTMATDRFFVRAHLLALRSSSLSRPTFGCHLCRAMECTGPDSTSAPCFPFVRRFTPTMRLVGFAIWMNPSSPLFWPGYIPLRLQVLQVSRAHPIPGVPGIPWAPRALLARSYFLQ